MMPPVMNRATVVAKRAFESLKIIVEKGRKIREGEEAKVGALEEREKKKEKKRECSENENEK